MYSLLKFVRYSTNQWPGQRQRRVFIDRRVALTLLVLISLTIGAALRWPKLRTNFTAKVSYVVLDFAHRNHLLAEAKATAAVASMAKSSLSLASATQPTLQTNGPLRVATTNPRYFADADGNIVYLTGSHTWSNLQDNGGSDPPPVFDYNQYLDFLEAHNHNFFRLWTWEEARWTTETTDPNYWFNPAPPFQRTGPGTSLDGKPKFDLTKLNQAYFDRMRARVEAAGQRGIYVSIMLFNGWSVSNKKGSFALNNPWEGHPFNRNNNINSIDGDPNQDNSGEEIHTLTIPAITALQEAYVKKVIDSVNDLDNVLYEISNESSDNSTAWQYQMINLIKTYEATKAQQHPVGMTVEYFGGDNQKLFDSPADWISPNGAMYDPPAADGRKVILHDSDHLCGICGDRTWVWMAFTRGLNPIFMDGYDGAGYGVGGNGFEFDSIRWVSLRRNLGYTRAFAQRMDMAAMTPQNDLASTGYCLANPASTNAAYLVYIPDGGAVTVNLSATSGDLTVEWFNPGTGTSTQGGTIQGGKQQTLTAPFLDDAVLYLYQPVAGATPTTNPIGTQTPTPVGTGTTNPVGTQTPDPAGTPTANPTVTLNPTFAVTAALTPTPNGTVTPQHKLFLPTIRGNDP